MAEITFIIPTISNFTGLKRCVDTIYKFHEPESFRIIVIDNSGTNEAFKAVGEKVHLTINSYRNLGYAKATNTGIKLSDTPWVVFMNDDVEIIHKDYFTNILEVFSRDEKILAVSPSSIKAYPVNPENDILSYKREYTQEDWDYLMSENNRMSQVFGWGDKFNKNSVLSGTMFYCVVCKKELFEKIGLLDEGYFPGSIEDYDATRRIYLAGYRILQTCNSFVYHHWETTKDKIKIPAEDYKKYRRWNSLEHKWTNFEGEKIDIYGNGGKKEAKTLSVPL